MNVHDAENHLISASGNGDSATYVYDGDGKMVKATVNGRTTTYIGDYYEWESKPNQPVFPNPGFEAEGNWWMHREFPATSNYMVKGNEMTPYEGDASASISNLAWGEIFSPILGIQGGRSFNVNAYIKGEMDTDGSDGCFYIQVHFFQNEAYLETDNVVNCSNTISSSWQQYGGVAIAPGNANKLQVALWSVRNSGWVAFDDVTVIDTTDQTNIMVNGGFETATDWSTWARSEYPATGFARLGSGAHGGTYFYMIHNLTNGSIYTASANRVTVAAGETYDVYAYARGEMDPDDSYSAVYCWYIRVRFFDSSGTYMSSNYVDAARGCPGSLTTSWQNLGSRVTVPTGAVKMDVQLAASYSSGWVAFDDVQIYKVVGGARTGSNLAVNPSFESATGGWSVSLPAAAPASSVWRCNFGTAAGRNGGYAYSISNHMYGHPVSSKMPVNPGTQYRLSAFLKGKIDAEDSDGSILLRAYFYDSNGNYILDYDVVNTATVAVNWTEYAGTFTAPITATQVEIHVIAYCMTAQLQVDNFSVKLVTPTYTTISRKYYYAGGERVAMNSSDVGLAWILSDHLGSTTKVIRALDYAILSETRYKPFGQPRYVNGVSPTQRGFTGQVDEPDLGLTFFQSRFYDSSLGHFIQADSIIPPNQGVQGFDRYAYVSNNPVNRVDPTGHYEICGEEKCKSYDVTKNWYTPSLNELTEKNNNPEGRPESFFVRARANYIKMRLALFRLYGSRAVDSRGQIRDAFFISVLIQTEIGDLNKDSLTWKEAL